MSRQSFRSRFPPPWEIKVHRESFTVECGERVLVHIFVEDEQCRRDLMHRISWHDGLALARAIARLPELFALAEAKKAEEWKRMGMITPPPPE